MPYSQTSLGGLKSKKKVTSAKKRKRSVGRGGRIAGTAKGTIPKLALKRQKKGWKTQWKPITR